MWCIYFHIIWGAQNNPTVVKVIVPQKRLLRFFTGSFCYIEFQFVFWFSFVKWKGWHGEGGGLTCLYIFPWLWSTSFWNIFPLAEEVCWPKAFFIFGWRASDNVGYPCTFTLCSKNPLTVFQMLLKGLEAGQWIASHIPICQLSV